MSSCCQLFLCLLYELGSFVTYTSHSSPYLLLSILYLQETRQSKNKTCRASNPPKTIANHAPNQQQASPSRHLPRHPRRIRIRRLPGLPRHATSVEICLGQNGLQECFVHQRWRQSRS